MVACELTGVLSTHGHRERVLNRLPPKHLLRIEDDNTLEGGIAVEGDEGGSVGAALPAVALEHAAGEIRGRAVAAIPRSSVGRGGAEGAEQRHAGRDRELGVAAEAAIREATMPPRPPKLSMAA